jgi:hypothetical protein
MYKCALKLFISTHKVQVNYNIKLAQIKVNG